MKGAAILSQKSLPNGPMPTSDPFLFAVYHKDHYPAATNDDMEAPRFGNGSDFDPDAPYRMYHGQTIPGFPQHPHRGFETITATTEGIIDHADSVGNAGRYGQGDLQWMTAGKGVVHSEMFPLIHKDKENPLRLFQIWLNLPKKSKMVDPGFAMFWNSTIPMYSTPDGKATVTIWAGNGYFDVETNPNSPPENSWAADPSNDVAVFLIQMKPGAKLTLPLAKASSNGDTVSRSLFYIEGPSQKMKVDGKEIDEKVVLEVKSDVDIELEFDSEEEDSSEMNLGEFLMLQGKPIDEPVAQYGPFVMNTGAEIEQAFMDYQRDRFGGWPWPRDDMVFPREKSRFALVENVAKELSPPEIVRGAAESGGQGEL